MYHIIGADGKEYGPVTLEKVQQWISEGRVNQNTRMKPAGAADWQPAGSIPELIPLFEVGAQAQQTSTPPPPPPMPSSTLAIVSLVLGVLSMLCLAPLTAIPAIICGHIARSRIRQNPSAYRGANQALVGLILGYASIALLIAILPAMLLPALSRAKGRAQEINCMNNMKQMVLAFQIWSLDNGEFPFNVSTNKGGTLEFATPSVSSGDPNGYRHLAVMSNALSTTKILVCPADMKAAAAGFASLGPENVSYEIMSGPDVKQGNASEVLIRCPIHNHRARVDGSVTNGRTIRR